MEFANDHPIFVRDFMAAHFMSFFLLLFKGLMEFANDHPIFVRDFMAAHFMSYFF